MMAPLLVDYFYERFCKILYDECLTTPALDGLCIWMMQISSLYIGHEEDFNFILISFCLIISSLDVL